ncbi:MAG: hypothetical protein NTY53_20955 [Kiritimatiellaeota bacterium]|nr:hypothetical protein [Kiritimatiellota bacterium]
MKTFSKMLVLFMTLTLGGYAGVLAAPLDLTGNVATFGSIFVIAAGALVGLFVGGLIWLLWD